MEVEYSSIEQLAISVSQKYGTDKVEKVIISEDEYTTGIDVCVAFKSGRFKFLGLRRVDMLGEKSINDFIIDQIKGEIPYMDRKMREIYGGVG